MVEEKQIKLDLGCGTRKVNEDFIGVDCMKFDNVDLVLNLTEKESSVQNPDFSVTHVYKKWPWADDSVDEIYCSHFVEHLDANERVHFVNEVYRILKKGSKCQIIIPHWSSCRAFGDLTHKFPPVSEFWFYYLSKVWRDNNAPHNDFYVCDFDVTWGFSLHPSLQARNQEYQNYAMQNYKEAIQDTVATLIKK